MVLPRRLMTLADGRFCEEDDPKQAMNFRPKGFIIPDAEAERIGLKAYLDETGYGEVAETLEERNARAAKPQEKAVAQSEVEDKAIHPEETKSKDAPKEDEPEKHETPTPGLHIEPESRRGGAGGRR
jgi:hypothetical protein